MHRSHCHRSLSATPTRLLSRLIELLRIPQIGYLCRCWLAVTRAFHARPGMSARRFVPTPKFLCLCPDSWFIFYTLAATLCTQIRRLRKPIKAGERERKKKRPQKEPKVCPHLNAGRAGVRTNRMQTCRAPSSAHAIRGLSSARTRICCRISIHDDCVIGSVLNECAKENNNYRRRTPLTRPPVRPHWKDDARRIKGTVHSTQKSLNRKMKLFQVGCALVPEQTCVCIIDVYIPMKISLRANFWSPIWV